MRNFRSAELIAKAKRARALVIAKAAPELRWAQPHQAMPEHGQLCRAQVREARGDAYLLPFPVAYVDGAWRNAKHPDSMLAVTVVGWRQWES